MYVRQVKFGAWVLSSFSSHERRIGLEKIIAQCVPGTIGYEVRQFMAINGFQFVPRCEGHDFKHILLGFESEPFDEMRMEAFTYGNTGITLTSLIIYAMFLPYVPEIWLELPKYYQVGRAVKSITQYPIEELAVMDLHTFRASVGLHGTVKAMVKGL